MAEEVVSASSKVCGPFIRPYRSARDDQPCRHPELEITRHPEHVTALLRGFESKKLARLRLRPTSCIESEVGFIWEKAPAATTAKNKQSTCRNVPHLSGERGSLKGHQSDRSLP